LSIFLRLGLIKKEVRTGTIDEGTRIKEKFR